MIDGSVLIAGVARQREARFAATDAATGQRTSATFSESSEQDVADACAVAAEAAPFFAAMAPGERAAFLGAVADAIVGIGDELVVIAMQETGLPRMRLEGERGRTVNQLRLYASEVVRGEWLDVTIDSALGERVPPRPDLRRMNIALGPVAVFGASNFPLAFSVAGGDTGAAMAAGCPVVVKGHPAHPGTGELVARAVCKAVADAGLPPGTFAYLPGTLHSLSGALVSDLRIKAVGFTGSRKAGLALSKLAAARPEPIPVYAEMSAINPVFLLPAALDDTAEALGAAFVASLTMGAGQFCTNPGVLVALDGPGLDRFLGAAVAALASVDPAIMLSPGILTAYGQGVAALKAHPAIRSVHCGEASAPNRSCGALFETPAAQFLTDPALSNEVFGPSALVVRCGSIEEMMRVASALEGQLTATVHASDGDRELAHRLLPLLAGKAGRVLFNGWPTGVEVSHAMVHGGPFPATSNSRTTSVGTLAIARFLRPVCFQNVSQALLSPALQDHNPWNLHRTIDGLREVTS